MQRLRIALLVHNLLIYILEKLFLENPYIFCKTHI